MLTIGVDVGGSNLRVVLYHGHHERGRSEQRGGSMRQGEGTRLANQIADIVRPLLARHDTARADILVVGAAGAGQPGEQAELRAALEEQRLAWRVEVTSDAELARRAAFGDGPGVLLIAGTGSVALVKDAKGSVEQIGGLGWRMGDQGSAHWLGARGLEAVGAMHDHLGPVTHLAESLCAAVGAAGIAGLVRWSVRALPPEVALLGPVVLATADQGDRVAKSIREEAVAALTGIAMAAGADTLRVALTGGLIRPGRPLHEMLIASLEARGATVSREEIDPCRGALAGQ